MSEYSELEQEVSKYVDGSTDEVRLEHTRHIIALIRKATLVEAANFAETKCSGPGPCFGCAMAEDLRDLADTSSGPTCRDCGAATSDVCERECGYLLEIHDDHTTHIVCDECEHQHCMDI